LISIFILLLISVVAIALIVSSGTESALAGNYRASTSAYYAALSGVEEVRGRLLSKNAYAFKNTDPTFLPATLAVGTPYYVINPAAGEVVAPWDPASLYPDTQFVKEFLVNPPNPSPSALSVWNRNPLNTLGLPVPLYKWVRINAISEQTLRLDVFPHDTSIDPNLIYYDGTNVNDTGTGAQALELTALAALPNGSQKLLQYLVAPVPITLPNFPAALTFAAGTGNTVAFSAPTTNGSYYVSGNDISVPALPSCTPGAPVDAIATYHTLAIGAVINGGNGGTGIPSGMQPSYTGASGPPDVQRRPITNYQTPSQVDGLSQSIIQNADVIIPSGPTTYPLPTVNGSALSAATTGMTSTNPMTVVINGNLDLNAWHNTGYGLLLVIGNLNYDPDASWDGIVLVIGQGTVTGSRAGTGEFDGAFFVANTRDTSGNLLPDPNLGFASVLFATNMGGTGMRFSSCWIQAAQPAASYKILSFHEIPQ
jgi:hypothetical protein